MGTIAFSPRIVFPEGLSKDLWLLAEVTARIHRFKFSRNCAEEMQAFIEHGAEVLRVEPEPLNHGMVLNASHDVVRLVEMMIQTLIEEGHAPVNDATVMLESDLFRRIRILFCPCWPFC